MYYLETSSVLKTGKRLRNIAVLPECFTSGFVCFELITEIEKSEREFSARKACLATLLALHDSGLRIRWTLPRERLASAYGRAIQGQDDIGKLYQVIECAMGAASVSKFQEALVAQGLSGTFGQLKLQHAAITGEVKGIVQEAASLGNDVRSFVESRWPLADKREKRGRISRVREMHRRYLEASGHHSTIAALASFCGQDNESHATSPDDWRLAEDYDHSVDAFVRALGIAMVECKFGTHTIAENDFADLLHLMYLRDGDVLVSEEGENTLLAFAARESGASLKRIEELRDC